MGAGWAMVPLGEVMRPALDPHRVDASRSYPNLGIYGFGRGVFTKPPIEGTNTSASTLYRVRAGQFIYSRLFAFEGAYSIVPPECDGYFVSNEFPTFDCDSRRLDSGFLSWLFKRPTLWRAIAERSTGMGDRRQRIHPEQVLAEEVPLPPLDEQRRIVARIDALAAKIAEARGLREEAEHVGGRLPCSIIRADEATRTIRVRDVARLRTPDVVVSPDQDYQFAGVYSFGRGVFRSVRKMGREFSYPRLTRVRQGEFVYPKLMAWEGALGVVPAECDGMVVSTEFPVFEIDRTQIVPEVFDAHFRSPEVWPSLSGQSGGTNVRRRRLNPQDFLDLEMPLPSEATQRRLVDAVRRLQEVQRLRNSTVAELDALLPAILDRAFKGEM
jgi:type I restriction enzyme S subunit